ncbi:uncharacterized protein [Typha angustifolia]|uniref:uncharacterized protein n=1 Tax=Typha angustifolia TaxID=59011 RepID=UPI003C2E9E20
MAGLLAWAADVVGATTDDDDKRLIPVVFTPEQQERALELDQKAASLRRSIQDLRHRIPPSHISQRLPYLHAHSVASNAALALQLNSHSTTREQAQQREKTLQEENAAYEKAISNCQQKIEEKLHEADLLESKLKEMDLIEKKLKVELDKALEDKASQHEASTTASNFIEQVQEAESLKSVKSKDLEDKKNELRLLEETVQRLEDEWSLLQQESLKKPSPAQREKLLEKQLHSLIEQLTAKQAQAERLITEIHVKEKDLERLTDMQRKLDSGVAEMNAARNRFGRSFTVSGASDDYDVKAYRRPNHTGGRTENQQKLMLLRSAFVLYILSLHIIVFIRLSF